MEIIPAILEKDFLELQKKLKKAAALFKEAQIDVGDGSFVPEKFGCLEKITDLNSEIFLGIHLMIQKPWQKVALLAKEEKIQRVIFHYESFFSVRTKTRAFAVNNFINQLKDLKPQGKLKVGMALNPGTSANFAVEFIERLDELLLLGVEPGEQGQEFEPDILQKINFLKNFRSDILISIDGGVNDKNIKMIKNAGADRAYVGSFLWKDFNKSMQTLTGKSRITNLSLGS